MKKAGLKKLLVIVIAAAVVIGAVAVCLWPEQVETIKPEKRNVDSTLRVTGTICGDREQIIYSVAAGTISDSDVAVGSIVKQGDVLATYDTSALENEVRLAEDALACANGSIKDAQGVQDAYSRMGANAQAQADAYTNEYNAISDQINQLLQKQEANSVAISNTISDNEGRIANLSTDYESKSSELAAGEERLEGLKNSDAYVAYQAYSNAIPGLKKELSSLESEKAALEEEYSNETDPTRKSELETEIADKDTEIAGKNTEITAAKDYIAGNGGDDTSMAIPGTLKSIEACQNSVNNLKKDVNQKKSDLSDAQNQLASVNNATLSTDEYALLLNLQTRLTDVAGKMEAARGIQASAAEGKVASSGVSAYQAAIDMSQDQLDIAKGVLTKAQGGVTAPENGVVVEKYVDKGVAVENGQELYLMQTTDKYVVRTTVSKYDISKIQVGQAAEVKLGNLIYSGCVSAINPVAVTDASGKAKIRVDITIEEPDENLILGIETEVVIHTGEVNEAITLPVTSIFSDEGGDFVYVFAGSETRKKYVECGFSDGEYTEILSGITLNDNVVKNATGLEE